MENGVVGLVALLVLGLLSVPLPGLFEFIFGGSRLRAVLIFVPVAWLIWGPMISIVDLTQRPPEPMGGRASPGSERPPLPDRSRQDSDNRPDAGSEGSGEGHQ